MEAPTKERRTRSDAFQTTPGKTKCGHVRQCGCEDGASCCFKCPLPECVLVPGQLLVQRDEAVITLLHSGLTISQVAKELGISRREVFRRQRRWKERNDC